MPEELTLQPEPPKTEKNLSLSLREGSILVVALVLLALLGWLAPSYKSIIKERDELKTQVATYEKNSSTETDSIPEKIGNQIVYRTVTKTVVKEVGSSSSTDNVKDYSKTVVKRGSQFVGLGLSNDLKKELITGADLIGPLGVAIQTNTDFDAFSAFVTLKL